MIFNLLTKTLYMYIYGTGISDVLIAPDVVKKLFSGKYLIG
jgi:hypothetical protein